MRRVLIVVAMFAVLGIVAVAPADARRHRPPPTTTRPRPTTTTRPPVTTTRPTTTTEPPTMPTYVIGTPLVNVTAYGALCDGSTNDTAAVQAAANAAAGKTLMFPAGTCRVDRVVVPANTKVTGHGPTSIVKQRTLSAGVDYPVFEVGNNVTISALKIDGNGTANIPDVWAESYNTAGGNYKTAVGRGRGYRAGIRGEAITGLTVTNVEFTAIAGAAIATNNSSQITVTNCYLHDSAYELVYIGGSTGVTQSGQNVVVSGNHVGAAVGAPAGALAGGFKSDAVFVSRVHGGSISNNVIDDADRSGIKLRSVQNFDVANNTIAALPIYAIHINGGSTGLVLVSNTDDGAATGNRSGAFAWPFPDVVNHAGAELINTAAEIIQAGNLGLDLSMNYETTVTGAVATQMTNSGMKYLDRHIADLIYTYSPPYSNHTPTGPETTAILADATTYLTAAASNPLIAGHYVLDDWPGDVHAVLEQITALAHTITPTKPTVVGVVGILDFWPPSDPTHASAAYQDHSAFNQAMVNYTSTSCDLVDFYVYGIPGQINFPPLVQVPAVDVDWAGTVLIPYIKAALLAKGWDPSTGFIISPQTFTLGNGVNDYPEPNAAQIKTETAAFVQAGAISTLAYVYDQGGIGKYLENTINWRTAYAEATTAARTVWGL